MFVEDDEEDGEVSFEFEFEEEKEKGHEEDDEEADAGSVDRAMRRDARERSERGGPPTGWAGFGRTEDPGCWRGLEG